MKMLLFAFVPLALIACDAFKPQPRSLDEIRSECRDEARDAAGISGSFGIGANNRTGAFTNASININLNNLGKEVDTDLVYQQCVDRLVAANTKIQES